MELLVVIAIIGILVALLLPAVQAAREAARRTQCVNNMKQVGLAMANHEGTYKRLPAGNNGWKFDPNMGIPRWMGHTAFFQLLPFLEEGSLYSQFDLDVRWADSPNAQLLDERITPYQCPSDEAQDRIALGVYSRSNYCVSYGTTDLYAPTAPHPQWGDVAEEVHENNGPFRMNIGREFRNFEDGLSRTIIASEVVAGTVDELTAAGKVDLRGTWGLPFWGAIYVHYYTPNSSAPDELFVNHCTAEAQTSTVNPCVIVPTRPNHGNVHVTARSRHPGGVNAVFADGHVDFRLDEVDLDVWQALATIAGSEVISGE